MRKIVDIKKEKEIGEQIRTIRLIRKKSGQQVAKAIGVSVTQYYKYENGTNRVAVSRLEQIADYLEIDINKLLPGSIKI